MILRAFRRQAAVCARPAGLAACLALAAVAGCDRVPLTAPTEATIALYAAGASVPSNGSIDIVATVTESAGTVVQNGTVVTFTTTLGSITPAEARTNNGKVTVKLTGDGRSGTASIVAFSGAAKSDAITVPIGGAAAETVTVSATPGSVSSAGGTVQLTATVRDASGNGLAGVPVTFSSTAGTLAQTTVTTDANGQAANSLVTTRAATVTARAGGKEGTAEIDVAPVVSLQVGVDPDSPIVGQPAIFTITVGGGSSDAPAPPLQSLHIDFGDGSGLDLGTGSTSVSHVYANDGTYTVTVRAQDTTGQQYFRVLVIIVVPAAPLAVTLAISPESPTVGAVTTFTANVTPPSGVNIEEYRWNFGDGQSAVTTGNTTTHIYRRVQTVRASVTVEGSNGTTGQASGDVRVQP